VKFARARGLPDRVVHFGHALRNTLVPVLTISGLQLGGLIAFSIITETVFAWPGMGSLFIQAVQFPDVPVMAGLPVPDRAGVRRHQPGGGSCSMRSSIRACAVRLRRRRVLVQARDGRRLGHEAVHVRHKGRPEGG
jgi:hypothetical protein